MPKIDTKQNPNLEDMIAQIGDSNAKSLRGGAHSISAKTGLTARLGSLWDRATKREETKALQAEAALVAAYKQSTGGIEPTAEQKALISSIVRGNHPEGIKAGMELLKRQADVKKEEVAMAAEYEQMTGGIQPTAEQKALISSIAQGNYPQGAEAGKELLKQQAAKAVMVNQYEKITEGIPPTDEQKALISDIAEGKHPEGAEVGKELLKQQAEAKNAQAAPIRAEIAPKKAEMDEIMEQLGECKNSQEVSEKLARLAQLQREVLTLEGKLGLKNSLKNDDAAQDAQALQRVQQNKHLQGADKACAVAMARMPIECGGVDKTNEFIEAIQNDNSLSEEDKNLVLTSLARHAAKEVCLESLNMGDLGRSSSPSGRYLANLAQKELANVGEDIAGKLLLEADKMDLVGMQNKETQRLAKPGTPEALKMKGLEDAYQSFSAAALNNIIEGAAKASPQAKNILGAVKQGAMDAAAVKPGLLEDGATPEDMGNQLVQAQLVLRAVNPVLGKKAAELNKPIDKDNNRKAPEQFAKDQANAQMLINSMVVIQGYDSFMFKESPARLADGNWSKVQNATIDAMRKKDPDLLKRYRQAGTNYAGNGMAEGQSVKAASPAVQNSPAQGMDMNSGPAVEAEGEIRVNPKRLSVGDSLRHSSSGAGKSQKAEAPDLPGGKHKVKDDKPEKEIDPEKMTFQQKRSLFNR